MRRDGRTYAPTTPVLSGPIVVIGPTHIQVTLAKTDEEKQKGLSGMSLLGDNNGMLFIFSQPYIYRFWMKDMMFPIDIIWINDSKIVDISHNVPNNFDIVGPQFYKPRAPASFVLEVNAGFAAKKGVKIGDAVSFVGF